MAYRRALAFAVKGIAGAALATLAAQAAWGQDPVKVAPQNFKVLLENQHVRVLDFHSTAGQKIAMHSHPAYVSYSVAGTGKTKFTSPDGKTAVQPSSPAGAAWHEAVTHASEYLGPGATHVLIVELKGK